MTICFNHRPSDPFARIDKRISFDRNLSLKAKGLLLIAFSRPPTWKFFKGEMIAHSSDGESSFDSGIKELEEAGYLHRTRSRNEANQLNGWEWHWFETPITEDEFKKSFRNGGFPGIGEFQISGEPGPNKKESNKKEKDLSASPKGEAEAGNASGPVLATKPPAGAAQPGHPEISTIKDRSTGCPAPPGGVNASQDANRVDSLESQQREFLRGLLAEDGCDEDFIRELFDTYSLDDICRSARYVATKKPTNFPGMLRSSLVDGYGSARGKLPDSWNTLQAHSKAPPER